MNLPNLITLLRIVLVPFFFTQLVSYHSGEEFHRIMSLIILIAASLSDALDGFLARALKQKTQLGTFLDPLADKLLILSGFLGLLFVHEALPYTPPLWITVAVVFRELVITLGLIVIFLIRQKIEVRPNLLGKCCTAAQMITLCVILFKSEASFFFSYLTAALTISSCAVYAIREIKKLSGVS